MIWINIRRANICFHFTGFLSNRWRSKAIVVWHYFAKGIFLVVVGVLLRFVCKRLIAMVALRFQKMHLFYIFLCSTRLLMGSFSAVLVFMGNSTHFFISLSAVIVAWINLFFNLICRFLIVPMSIFCFRIFRMSESTSKSLVIMYLLFLTCFFFPVSSASPWQCFLNNCIYITVLIIVWFSFLIRFIRYNWNCSIIFFSRWTLCCSKCGSNFTRTTILVRLTADILLITLAWIIIF